MSVVLHLSAGQGPEECRWAVWRLARAFVVEAAAGGLSCVPVEPIAGPAASVLLRVEGEDAAAADAFARARTGTVRWIGTSPFRPTHRRKNWFVAVTTIWRPGKDT